MMFVEKFEPIVRNIDDTVSSLGLFNSYEEANDKAIEYAYKDLPKESVKAYQIVKSFVNTKAMPS